MRHPLLAVALTCLACGTEPSAAPAAAAVVVPHCEASPNDPACPCIACDDGDPCTHDRCLPGGSCGRVAAAGCACVPACSATTELQPLQALAQHDGGLTGLAGVRGLAVTADGRHGYVAASGSARITLLVRDGDALTRGTSWALPSASDGAIPVPLSVALSASEDALWVGASSGIYRLARDVATGALDAAVRQDPLPAVALVVTSTWLAASDGKRVQLSRLMPAGLETVGEDGASDVRAVERLAVSPDGATLAGAAFDSDALLVWKASAGGLERLATATGHPSLDGPNDVLVLSDGNGALRVYVTGFCDARVGAFRLAGADLTLLGATGAPGTVCPAPDAPWERRAAQGPGRVARPVALAALPGVGVVVHGLELATQLTRFVPDGAGLTEEESDDEAPEPWLPPASAFLGGGWDGFAPIDEPARRGLVRLAVAGTAIWAASGLTDAVTVIDGGRALGPVASGAGGVANVLGAYTLDLAPDGRHLYVAPRGLATLGVFAVDPATGGLTQLASPQLPGSEERGDAAVGHVDVVADGRLVLATETGRDELHVLERDVAAGTLAHQRAVALPGCAGDGGAFPADVLASPDSRDSYVTDFQVKGKSCIYHVPLVASAPVQVLASPALAGIETLVFDPTGHDLYAACVLSKSVVHLARDAATGALEIRGAATHDMLYGAEMMALAPNGETLWVSSPISNRLVVLERDPATGSLAYRSALDASPTLPIQGAAGLAVSSDASRLYVAARDSAAVAVFSVAQSGDLTYLRALAWPGVLEFANGIRLSSDGRTLYTAAVAASAVGVIRVGPALGGGCDRCP